MTNLWFILHNFFCRLYDNDFEESTLMEGNADASPVIPPTEVAMIALNRFDAMTTYSWSIKVVTDSAVYYVTPLPTTTCTIGNAVRDLCPPNSLVVTTTSRNVLYVSPANAIRTGQPVGTFSFEALLKTDTSKTIYMGTF